MKQFFTILKFELDNYFKSKSYVISTILIAVLAAGIMFVPRVKDAITEIRRILPFRTALQRRILPQRRMQSIHTGSTIRKEY